MRTNTIVYIMYTMLFSSIDFLAFFQGTAPCRKYITFTEYHLVREFYHEMKIMVEKRLRSNYCESRIPIWTQKKNIYHTDDVFCSSLHFSFQCITSV